jgi:ABC-2 type transport system ATP-binding protein
MIVVEDLVKEYPNGVRAVSGINFTVSRGEFFGFLGPNGAGKSTTIKILSTLIRKTMGRVIINGFDIEKDALEIRRHIGFAMQEVGLDDLSSGLDFLELQGMLYGMSRTDSRRRADELLALVGLTSVAMRKVDTYSGGMRRRIDLVAALMHSPILLFLDEPTTGLDPQSRLAIWDYLQQLNSKGMTVFLSTHIMEEADRLCERIAIIDNGKLVAEGSPQQLRSQVSGDVVKVIFSTPVSGSEEDNLSKAIDLIRQRDYVLDASVKEGGLTINVRNGDESAPDLLRLFHDQGMYVANLSVSSPSLDNVFLKYTGKQIRDSAPSTTTATRSARPWSRLGRR